MRIFSHFLSFVCSILFVISSSNSQSNERNNYRFITEIIKMKEKFDYLSDQMDQLKNKSDFSLNLDQVLNQFSLELNRSKQREDDLLNLINDLKEEWKLKLEVEVTARETHEKECKQREETIKNQVDAELSALRRRAATLEKSAFLTKPHIYFRFTDEYYNKKEPDFTWTIDDIRNKVKRTNFTLLSEVFPLKGYSFGARAKLTLDKEDYLEISLAYKDLSESGKDLNLKLIPSVYFTYKGQSSNHTFREMNYLFTSLMQYGVFYYERWILPSKDIASDTISVDIHVEPPEDTQRGYSQDGSVAWSVKDFRSKKGLMERRLAHYQTSPTFYTGPKGYRVRADLWLIGSGDYMGKGLTIEIVFLTGPYDADLSRSFKHRTTVTLFHPTDSDKSIVKSVDRDLKNGEWYRIDMGTHAEIESLVYDDTLYYYVKIAPA